MSLLNMDITPINVDSPESSIWHPFSSRYNTEVIKIDSAKGVMIYDESGKSYMDLISSWWVNLYGHSNEIIAKAVADQAARMEHVIFSGFTHTPAENLCEGLKEILPPKLSRFFFSDNGSTAVEIALKMSYQYWINQGKHNKKTFLSFEGGYHGDTWGAMSVGKGSGFYSCFEGAMLPVSLMPYPDTWEGDEDIEAKEASALAHIESHLKKNSDQIVAFIMEPLIQGAGGMRVCRSEFLVSLLSLLKHYGIIVIFDEVMTGFGRTGNNFVVDTLPEELLPDFLCLAKGMTGGFLPLAVTVLQAHIYDSFISNGSHFNHGHSYTANPIACAAATAALGLLEGCQGRIDVITQVNKLVLENVLLPLNGFIERVRVLGSIMAFEIKPGLKLADGTMDSNFASEVLYKAALERGLLIRPLGNVVYTIPPYCITSTQLIGAYFKLSDIIKTHLVP